jgi:hypothetical protein
VGVGSAFKRIFRSGLFLGLWWAFRSGSPHIVRNYSSRLLSPARFRFDAQGQLQNLRILRKEANSYGRKRFGALRIFSEVEPVAFSPILLYSKYFTNFV